MKEISTKYVNPFTLLTDLLRNWWVILLAAVIGFCGSQIYHSAYKVEKFTSTTTISVNLSGYTDNATVTSLSRTIDIATAFQNVLKSSALVDIVENKLGEPLTGEVSAVQKAETNLIDISVTDISPEKAYKTLQLIYENYPVLTDSAFSNIIISVVTPPTMATRSNYLLQLYKSVFTAFVFAVICIVIILVISYFRDTVKNVSDVEILLDCKLFGPVNHINKKVGKSNNKLVGLMMTNPLVDYRFSNSFRELAIKLIGLQRKNQIKTIMVTSFAENEGKTTATVNLAIALAEAGKKTLIMDCDFKLSSVYKFFKDCPVSKDGELAAYLLGGGDHDQLVRYNKNCDLYLTGGKKQYRNSSEILNSDRFSNLLKEFREDYDFVIIDTPPAGIAVDSEIISEKTDASLLVVRQDCVTVEQINDYISDINEEKLLGCIFNNVSYLRENPDYDKNNSYYAQGEL